MFVYIDDLPLEMLELILSFLDDKFFLVERVSKQQQKRVLKILKKFNYYSKKLKDDPSGRWNIISEDNIRHSKKKYCPNIKILDLSCTNVTGNSNLLLIANLVINQNQLILIIELLLLVKMKLKNLLKRLDHN